MQTALYLGTDPTHFLAQGHWEGNLIHYPVIKIVPRSHDEAEIATAFQKLPSYTHIVFTSKNAVRIFFDLLSAFGMDHSLLKEKNIIAVGKVTAKHLSERNLEASRIADLEQQEGIIALLDQEDLSEAFFFLPRSALSRPVLEEFLHKKGAKVTACDLYDTFSQNANPAPSLDCVDAIIFTSPSTVRAFFEIYQRIPKGKKLLAIGAITEEALKNFTSESAMKPCSQENN